MKITSTVSYVLKMHDVEDVKKYIYDDHISNEMKVFPNKRLFF